MLAKSPEEICRLFRQHMRDGDLDSVLSLYDPEAVFLNQAGEVKKGEGLRQELAHLAAAKAAFDLQIRQVIQSGDTALMHTEWEVSSPRRMSLHAVEVARRRRDVTWRWLNCYRSCSAIPALRYRRHSTNLHRGSRTACSRKSSPACSYCISSARLTITFYVKSVYCDACGSAGVRSQTCHMRGTNHGH